MDYDQLHNNGFGSTADVPLDEQLAEYSIEIEKINKIKCILNIYVLEVGKFPLF
jgi:hypothetical protein